MIWRKKEQQDPAPTGPRKVCPLCLRAYYDDSIYCRMDGQKLQLEATTQQDQSKQIECPNCGFTLSTPRQRCPICGHIFSNFRNTNETIFINLIPEAGLPIKIDKFPYSFGRKDVIRNHYSEYVNIEHIIFSLENGHFYIRDKKSLNGSSLNGHVIGGKRFENLKKLQLADGDEVGLALDSNGISLIRFKVEIPQMIQSKDTGSKIPREEAR
ncbi:MAG: FHA domain-containing protein [Thermoplasmata archaeon]